MIFLKRKLEHHALREKIVLQQDRATVEHAARVPELLSSG